MLGDRVHISSVLPGPSRSAPSTLRRVAAMGMLADAWPLAFPVLLSL
jgi:hypothetical protein